MCKLLARLTSLVHTKVRGRNRMCELHRNGNQGCVESCNYHGNKQRFIFVSNFSRGSGKITQYLFHTDENFADECTQNLIINTTKVG